MGGRSVRTETKSDGDVDDDVCDGDGDVCNLDDDVCDGDGDVCNLDGDVCDGDGDGDPGADRSPEVTVRGR